MLEVRSPLEAKQQKMDDGGLNGANNNANGANANNGNDGGGEMQNVSDGEPTFAEKMLTTIRTHIESGQAAMGAQGHHSNNAIINPMRALADQSQLDSQLSLTDPSATNPSNNNSNGMEKRAAGGQGKNLGLPTVVSAAVPMSPRKAHEMASAAHAEARRKRRILEDAKHKKERDDKLSRYLALIICIVVIILSLLGMAAISRRVIGKWWYGAPDPTPEVTSTKISHSPALPSFSSLVSLLSVVSSASWL